MSECSASGIQERKRASDVIMLKLKGALESERLVTLRVKSSVAGHLQKILVSAKKGWWYSSTGMAVVFVVVDSTCPKSGEFVLLAWLLCVSTRVIPRYLKSLESPIRDAQAKQFPRSGPLP